MTESELRSRLLAQLTKIAERLPNGLLHRLVEDAQFFYEWNLRKKRARASARLGQYRAWQDKAEDRYWREVGRRR
jgi:hypothetical protein